LHYILGGEKAGIVDVEIGHGVVLYSDLLGGVLSKETMPSATINPPPDNNSNQSINQTSPAPSANQPTAPSANIPTPSPPNLSTAASVNLSSVASTNPSIPSSANEPLAPSANPTTATNANPPAATQKKREFVFPR
jgi:hypothetical protein